MLAWLSVYAGAGPAEVVARETPGLMPDVLWESVAASLEIDGSAGWHNLTAAETAAAVAELRQIAGGRADLLAEVAGILQGASEAELDEPRARAAAQLCIAAGADHALIPQWIAEGKRRAEAARRKPGTWRPAP